MLEFYREWENVRTAETNFVLLTLVSPNYMYTIEEMHKIERAKTNAC